MGKRVFIIIVVTLAVLGFLATAQASFMLSRHQFLIDENCNRINKTANLINVDLGKWSFGTEFYTAGSNYECAIPFICHNIPFSGWQGGIKFEHDSLENNSFVLSVRYAGVKSLFIKPELLLLFQTDLFFGDQERIEIWGHTNTVGCGWNIGAEGFFLGTRHDFNSYQLRPLWLGYNFGKFGPLNSFTPFVMFERRWDVTSDRTSKSASVFIGIKFTW